MRTPDLSERQMLGHYEVIYSPDDGGFYACMWWANTINSPIFRSWHAADAWAKKHGGTTQH